MGRQQFLLLSLVVVAIAVSCASPTPTPTPALITVGPGDNPQAFLQAIPATERDCLSEAFGAEILLNVFGSRPPSPDDTAKLTGCLSEDTARRMMLGMLIMELDISEQGMACINAELRDVNFLALYGQRPGEGGIQGQTFTFSVFRAALNCLSEEEAAGMFGGIEEGDGPSMDQFKCLFESADDETVAELFAMGAGGGQGASPRPQLLDLIAKCGPIPDPGGGSGPPDLTPEQQTCVINAIGEAAFSQLFTQQRLPNSEELQKIETCVGPIGPG